MQEDIDSESILRCLMMYRNKDLQNNINICQIRILNCFDIYSHDVNVLSNVLSRLTSAISLHPDCFNHLNYQNRQLYFRFYITGCNITPH